MLERRNQHVHVCDKQSLTLAQVNTTNPSHRIHMFHLYMTTDMKYWMLIMWLITWPTSLLRSMMSCGWKGTPWWCVPWVPWGMTPGWGGGLGGWKALWSVFITPTDAGWLRLLSSLSRCLWLCLRIVGGLKRKKLCHVFNFHISLSSLFAHIRHLKHWCIGGKGPWTQ